MCGCVPCWDINNSDSTANHSMFNIPVDPVLVNSRVVEFLISPRDIEFWIIVLFVLVENIMKVLFGLI